MDFELELIHRDEINVAYILQLLLSMKGHDPEKRRREIYDKLSNDPKLRSKRELINKFILENLPLIEDTDDLSEAFDRFWNEEQTLAFKALCEEEKLSSEKVEKIIDKILYTERTPLRDELLGLIEGSKPTMLQRKTVGDRILEKINRFVETFMNGMGN